MNLRSTLLAFTTAIATLPMLVACSATEDSTSSADGEEAQGVSEADVTRRTPTSDVYDCSLVDSHDVSGASVPMLITIGTRGLASNTAAEIEIVHETQRKADAEGKFSGKWGKGEPDLDATLARSGNKLTVTSASETTTIKIDLASKTTGVWGGQGRKATVTEGSKTFKYACTGFSTKEWLSINTLSTSEPEGKYLKPADAPAALQSIFQAANAAIDDSASNDGVTLDGAGGIYEMHVITGGAIAGYAVWASQETDDPHEEGHQQVYLVGFDPTGKELFREFGWVP